MHGGPSNKNATQETLLRKYRLQQWQARTGEFADDNEIKSLREEIGILRMTLENVITQCNGAMDIVLWSGKIGDLVSKIEKLVTSCDRLEGRSGMLLDKGAALTLAAQMVEIITKHVADPEAIEAISTEIATVIANLNTEPT
jgi:hypothetical protein